MKYLIVGIIILTVLVGGYALMKSGNTGIYTGNVVPTQADQQVVVSPSIGTPVTELPQMNTSSVEYTQNGFIPKSMTVKVGTTVIWINKDINQMWVASAPHPQHTDLPGFDALKGYKTGETYSYTFTKVGNWKYHDHLTPSNSAVVNVTQ